MNRRNIIQVPLIAAAAGAGPAFAAHPASTDELLPDRPHDFDFLVGVWHVAHRRLKERLANNDQWEEFTGKEEVVGSISAGLHDGQPVQLAPSKP